VIVWVYSIQDDGNMGPELGDDIEHSYQLSSAKMQVRVILIPLTPKIAEYKLQGGIALVLPVETYCNSSCGNGDGTNMVGYSHIREFRAEYELE
jgi:hypothetical protein